MRKVTSGLFISLDGVVEAPHLWQFDVFDADMGDAMIKFLAGIDTVLLGRVTYQEWAAYWPNATTDGDYAVFINETPKHVASTTLTQAEWQNSTLITGDVAAAVAGLKAQPGAGPLSALGRSARRADAHDPPGHCRARQASLPRRQRAEAAGADRLPRHRQWRGDPDLRQKSRVTGQQF